MVVFEYLWNSDEDYACYVAARGLGDYELSALNSSEIDTARRWDIGLVNEDIYSVTSRWVCETLAAELWFLANAPEGYVIR